MSVSQRRNEEVVGVVREGKEAKEGRRESMAWRGLVGGVRRREGRSA